MTILFRTLANLWGLFCLAGMAGALLWFVYSIYLRKAFRARRIAGIRMRRLVQEAAERETGGHHS
jgi:hypothetical protein